MKTKHVQWCLISLVTKNVQIKQPEKEISVHTFSVAKMKIVDSVNVWIRMPRSGNLKLQ